VTYLNSSRVRSWGQNRSPIPPEKEQGTPLLKGEKERCNIWEEKKWKTFNIPIKAPTSGKMSFSAGEGGGGFRFKKGNFGGKNVF